MLRPTHFLIFFLFFSFSRPTRDSLLVTVTCDLDLLYKTPFSRSHLVFNLDLVNTPAT